MSPDLFTRELGLLTSPEAAGLLHAALTGSSGIILPGYRAEVDRIHHRPGAELSVGFRVAYHLPGSAPREEYLVATTAQVDGPVATLTHDEITLRVWRHPGDPRLPGLAPGCDPQVVAEWLRAAHLPGDLRELELLVYRPLRRAVLRAATDVEVAFLKVMRPTRSARLVRRQQLLAAAGLTPGVAGEPAPGVVLTPTAPGVSLAEALVAWEATGTPPPEPAALVTLLDRLPADVLTLPRRPAWSERLDFHAAAAAAVLPERTAMIADLRRRLEQILAEAPTGPVVPTHGDFYEANIRVVDGQPAMVIDVDSVGPGLREDDLACCLAHLEVLPRLANGPVPAGRRTGRPLGRRVRGAGRRGVPEGPGVRRPADPRRGRDGRVGADPAATGHGLVGAG